MEGNQNTRPPLTIRLADLFSNVNRKDESFLKYYFTPIVKVEGARNRPHNPPVPIVDQIPNAVNP